MNSGEPLTLLMIDIDHFKRVNDRFGHPTGDQVLRLVAATLAGGLRPDDFVARYGGEEFAVILVNTPAAAAHALAERVRRSFVGRQIVARGSGTNVGEITLSGGCASYDPGERLSDWVERADRALYTAKQSGRNRVVLAEDADKSPSAASERQAATVV